MEIAAPVDIDTFFTNLKNIWFKRQPSTFTYNENRNLLQSNGSSSLLIIVTNSSPTPYQSLPQKDNNNRANAMLYKAQDYLESIAERLGYSDEATRNPDALKQFIDDELYSRLGYANYHLRKESFGQVREVNTRVMTRASTSDAKKVYATNKLTKKLAKKPTKVTYKCSNCEKIGHRKNMCPEDTKLKKINYTYQNEPENSDDEKVVILEDNSDSEKEKEITSDNELQLCFNVKKKSDSCKEEAFY
ncbi:hypothetical protein Glove_344g24 [Diversispora epigaea]|uniref:CCHC-type domain-containing protein n=1 Tax=Diversispora epigaea TaxID=1348612 RepID=A0A397HFZ6_9GLOM|nr:hypothetical protein Glove_344g24 [Diversispora epigaea]